LHLAREAVQNFNGDRQEQAEDLTALQALAEALNDARWQTEVALRQAHYAQVTGDYPAAIKMAQVAVRLTHSQDQQSSLHRTYHEAVGHLQWGEALSRQGAYETARIHFLRAQDLALAGQRATSEESATERPKLNLRDRVAGAQRDAAELLKSIEADSFRCLGGVCWHQGNSSEAEMHYEQALTIYRQIGNQWGEAKVANGLGVLAWSRGDPDEASDCFEQSLRIYHEIGHRRGLVQAFGNLADMVMYQGDYSGAQRLFDRTVRMCREIGEPWIEGGILNNLGVAADRLGVYTEAAAFLEHALRVRREIGDRQGQAEGLSDLSLLYHHMSDDETALDYGEQALYLIEELNNPFMKGFVLTRMAHAQVSLDQLDEAATAYREALHLRRKGGQIHLIAEALAGLARVSLVREELEQALARTEEILDLLRIRKPMTDPATSHGGTSSSDSVVVGGHDLGGADEPVRVYLTCYRVLRATGDRRDKRILSLAYDLLQRQAAKIDDEKLRSSFLTNVLVHRETVAAFQELQASQQESRTLTEKPVTVSLPSADAPLGRPVREDEFVIVTWTVAAPEDETIAGKVARRRHRILRLLQEAQAQGAAPTHSHLAGALGVSRRTIERDMAALRCEHPGLPPTRGRMSE
jgi:tetratricopeptide (TPR) repeat protein